jgi:hypothetical protein
VSERRDYNRLPSLRPYAVLLAIVCAVFVLWWWLG